eukprot:SAG31_NODE_10243_length_1165_cov_1.324578_1_plen_78_part_00
MYRYLVPVLATETAVVLNLVLEYRYPCCTISGWRLSWRDDFKSLGIRIYIFFLKKHTHTHIYIYIAVYMYYLYTIKY